MKVRWKGSNWKGGSGPDCWFAEASGLTTDSMRWSDGTKDNGWFSAHRMNGGGYLGYPMYGCSFNFDHTASGYWDESGTVYRDHVKDTQVSRSGFYDTTVVIDGITYYEIDFSLWSGATGYKLYMPYSNPLNKWSAGDVYVEIGEDDVISIDITTETVESSGGSFTVNVTAIDDWSASTSDNWISISPSSGVSGTSAVTVTVSRYTNTENDRTGSVVFTCEQQSATLTVKQNKRVATNHPVYLGTIEVPDIYLGTTAITKAYLGDVLVYEKTAPKPDISDIPFLVNYNAKLYEAGVGIPNHSAATGFNYTLTVTPASVSSDHITISRGTYMMKTLGAANNPFNGSTTNPAMTIIAKVGSVPSGQGTENHLFACRGNVWNWMFRQKTTYGGSFMLHTQSGDVTGTPNVSGVTTYPNIVVCRVGDDDYGYVKSVTDSITGNTYPAVYNTSLSDSICFFYGGYRSEYYSGDF